MGHYRYGGKAAIEWHGLPHEVDMPARSFGGTVATIPAGSALSNALDLRAYADASLHNPGGWTGAPGTLAFKGSPTEDGQFVPMYDQDGSLVSIVGMIGTAQFDAPEALFSAHFIKLWSVAGDGSDLAQASTRTFTVLLKG